jgi:hypothetical protein
MENDMSDKRYSPDELIDLLENRKSTCLNPITKMKYDAIIRKLRAADALKDAATLLRNECVDGAGDWMLSFIHRLDQAIAAYEEA